MSSIRHLLCLLSLLLAVPALADWPYYGGDAASTKFAPYEEITPANVDSLRIVWRWRLPEMELEAEEEEDEEDAGGMSGDGAFKSTPIVVDGVLYTSTPFAQVAALDATTGEQLWFFDPKTWQSDDTFNGLHRGVAYWSDGEQARIFFGTPTDTLYSLDASTGLPDPAFGQGGRVDLTKGMVRDPDPERYALVSPPMVCRDVVVVGSTIMDWHDGTSPESHSPPGDVRGYDARTGELLWTFHTVPQAGEYGNDTWEGDSWQHFGQANAWAAISADHELGYVYLSLSTPSHNWYGGERHGANLFGDSIVCLDARTGERVWHYQLVHHGLWNYDPPAAPILLDILVAGLPVRAVAMVSKQAYTYVFDRVSGDPVWPIEEMPVPASTVPGEQAWPTQPVPSKPAPYDRQGLTEDDLIDFTPELRAAALEIIAEYEYGPLFTPPGEKPTIALPGDLGGTDWAGAAADPRTGTLYVPSRTLPAVMHLVPSADSTAFSRYGGFSRVGLDGPEGLPLTKPPYGRLTAIDLNSGEHRWMRPIGRGPIDHPALRDLDLEELGWPKRIFVAATPGLLWVTSGYPGGGDGYFVDREAHLLALDSATGAELARIDLPANANGSPLVYEAGGRQYAAVPVGGGGFGFPGELVVLALPFPDENLPPQAWTGYGAEHLAFDRAVEAIDRGDRAALEDLLKAHPELVEARGFLHELYPYPSLRGASLLHLVAGYPHRARLPDNALDLARLLIEHGADVQALSADSTSVLGLVVKSRQLRWQGAQMDLVDLVVEQGVGDDPRLMWQAMVPPLQNEPPPPLHMQLARRFYEGGAAVDLPFAAALGLVEQMATFFDEQGALRPTANALYRPGSAGLSDQQVLDLALLYAVYGGDSAAVDFMLARGAAINGKPRSGFWEEFGGMTALHLSVWLDRADMVRLLLERGADPMATDLNFQAPPIGWAQILERDESAQVLQEAMAAMQPGAGE